MVVGLDPSLTGTGIALPPYTFAGDFEESGRLTVTSAAAGPAWMARRRRYTSIVAAVARAIVEHPDYAAHETVIVVEGYSFASKGAGHAFIIEAGFLLRWHLTPRCAALIEVPPASVKMYATGKGGSRKPELRMALYKRTGIDEPDENRVDAAWLRLMALDAYSLPGALDMPAAHRKALKAVAWPSLPVAARAG